jgi:hypothetical protein
MTRSKFLARSLFIFCTVICSTICTLRSLGSYFQASSSDSNKGVKDRSWQQQADLLSDCILVAIGSYTQPATLTGIDEVRALTACLILANRAIVKPLS